MTSSKNAFIRHIEYHIPETFLSTAELSECFPEWNVERIHRKTGIAERPYTTDEETAGDLAFKAAEKIFAAGICSPDEIDLLVLCTQTPDYVLPTTACLLQERLGLPTSCAAFDFNLGCSGYVYGLAIVKGLLETGAAQKALFLTGETYTKWIAEDDKSVRTIFGDGGSATLIELADGEEKIGPFVLGSDGKGAKNLIVHESGARKLTDEAREELHEDCRPGYLYMHGPRIFTFTVDAIPPVYTELLEKANITVDDLDYVVFHQANQFMLNHLISRCNIPEEKFIIRMEKFANTVSATIPIVLTEMRNEGLLVPGTKVALVGFGVGYSWGGVIVEF